MPTKRGMRRLCRVWGSREQAAADHAIIQQFLEAHKIAYLCHRGSDGYGREYWAYKVPQSHLCWAQTILGALEALQNDRVRQLA